MSLAGFTRLSGYTIPTIDSTSEAVVIRLIHADFTAGTLSSLRSDLGDLRFSSDEAGTQQLPIDPERTDVAGSDVLVWVRIVGLATGDVIHVWGDNPSATQPAANASFGSEEVWQDDLNVYQFNDNTGISSTGNDDLTLATGTSTTVSGAYGDAQDLSSVRYDGDARFWTTANKSLSVWVKPDQNTSGQYVSSFGQGSTGNYSAIIVGYQSGNFNIFDGGYPTGTASHTQIPATVGEWQKITFTTNGSTLKGFKNGVEIFSRSADLRDMASASRSISIGSSYGGTSFFNGAIQLYRQSGQYRTVAQESIEYENQSAIGAWGTMVDVGGGTPDIIVTISDIFLQSSRIASLVANVFKSKQKDEQRSRTLNNLLNNSLNNDIGFVSGYSSSLNINNNSSYTFNSQNIKSQGFLLQVADSNIKNTQFQVGKSSSNLISESSSKLLSFSFDKGFSNLFINSTNNDNDITFNNFDIVTSITTSLSDLSFSVDKAEVFLTAVINSNIKNIQSQLSRSDSQIINTSDSDIKDTQLQLSRSENQIISISDTSNSDIQTQLTNANLNITSEFISNDLNMQLDRSLLFLEVVSNVDMSDINIQLQKNSVSSDISLDSINNSFSLNSVLTSSAISGDSFDNSFELDKSILFYNLVEGIGIGKINISLLGESTINVTSSGVAEFNFK